MSKIYDSTKAWNENIKETVEKLGNACKEHGIPFVMFAAVKNTEDTTDYVYSGFSPEEAGVSLYEDRITNRLNQTKDYVENGIKADAKPMDDLFKE